MSMVCSVMRGSVAPRPRLCQLFVYGCADTACTRSKRFRNGQASASPCCAPGSADTASWRPYALRRDIGSMTMPPSGVSERCAPWWRTDGRRDRLRRTSLPRMPETSPCRRWLRNPSTLYRRPSDPETWWRPPPGSTGRPSNARWTTSLRWEASSEWSTTISIQPSWHWATPGRAARSTSRVSMPPAPRHYDDSGWPLMRPEAQEPAMQRCWWGFRPAPAMSCLPWGSPQPFAAMG